MRNIFGELGTYDASVNISYLAMLQVYSVLSVDGTAWQIFTIRIYSGGGGGAESGMEMKVSLPPGP